MRLPARCSTKCARNAGAHEILREPGWRTVRLSFRRSVRYHLLPSSHIETPELLENLGTLISVLPLATRTILLVFAVLLARPVLAQEQPPAEVPPADNGRAGQWAPVGPIPVDQAGAGLRGYALAGESTEVAEPGTDQVSLHAVAANNFYREQNGAFSISQRYETHTVALGYRRGFKVGMFPRVEFGGQFQLIEGDSGFMNGFISGSEHFLARLTGAESARNQWRTGAETLPALGTFVTKDGRPIYRAPGAGSGFGDFSMVAKALLRDGAPASTRARVAARVALNVSGKAEFTGGNFAGIGVSVDKKLLTWAALHADTRASVLLDRVSRLNLPLKRVSFGFSAGPELKLARNSSASVQIDGNTTPYLWTGATAFDRAYGNITLGLSHRFSGRQRQVVAQAYLRENMNLPFRVRWNTDPDLSLGIKFTIRSVPR